MNPLAVVTWLWRALRGHSVTFAALFALMITGFSATTWLRRSLRGLGLHWLIWLVVPVFLVGMLAKKEQEWIPEQERRTKWARGLVFGSILAALIAGWLMPPAPVAVATPDQEEHILERPRRRGPAGR